MARQLHPASRKRRSEAARLPLAQTNYLILGAGLIVILAGYIALAQEPWDGFLPLVVAPILLVIGYCVIVPVGILYRKKAKPVEEPVAPPPAE